MKTVIYAVTNDIDQYSKLPAVFVEEDTRFVRINEKSIELFYNGPLVDCNADLIISGPYGQLNGIKDIDVLLGRKMVKMPRYNKSTQAAMLSELLHLAENFIPLPTYRYCDIVKNKLNANLLNRGKMVIKPELGARGMRMYLLDTNVYNPITFIEDAFYGKRDSSKENEVVELVKVSPVDDHKKMLERYPGVVYSPGTENYSGEALTQQEPILQKYVKATEEYRLILNNDSEIYMAMKRKHVNKTGVPDSEFLQAIGVPETGSIEEYELVDYMALPHFDQISNVLKALNIPSNSVDLFYDEFGNWGIYEFCNQFGVKGFIPPIVEKFLIKDIVDKYKRVLNRREVYRPIPTNAVASKFPTGNNLQKN